MMRRSGQSLLEYAILIGLITVAIVGMQVYAKRGIQAGIKAAADGLSPFGASDPDGEKAQLEGMRYESGERRNRAIASPGTVRARESAVTTDSGRTVQRGETQGGGYETPSITETTTTTGALTSRGAGVSSYSEVIVGTN